VELYKTKNILHNEHCKKKWFYYNNRQFIISVKIIIGYWKKNRAIIRKYNIISKTNHLIGTKELSHFPV